MSPARSTSSWKLMAVKCSIGLSMAFCMTPLGNLASGATDIFSMPVALGLSVSIGRCGRLVSLHRNIYRRVLFELHLVAVLVL
jgi:hypothetical protein